MAGIVIGSICGFLLLVLVALLLWMRGRGSEVKYAPGQIPPLTISQGGSGQEKPRVSADGGGGLAPEGMIPATPLSTTPR